MKPTERTPAAGTALEHPKVAFETQDTHVGGVERAGLILAATIVLALAVCGGVYVLLMGVPQPGKSTVSPLLRSEQPRLPPSPQMQGIPGNSLPAPEQQREFQAAAAAKLNSYGWMDAQKGVAHIPVSEAMKRIVEQGLPEISPQVGTGGASARKKGR